MLIIHHLGISQSVRIIWLCEELALPYDIKLYERDPDTRMAPPEYKAIHPAGTSPTITDGDVTLAETGAIIAYILGIYARGRLVVPATSEDYSQYVYWMNYPGGTMQPALLIKLLFSAPGVTDERGVSKFADRRLEIGYDMIERRLGDAPYFGGSAFTAADIMMVFPLTRYRDSVPRDLTSFPNIRAYLERIDARPAYRSALALDADSSSGG